MGDWGPVRVVRDAAVLTFRGSRADLERVTACRLQTAFVFIFLAGRCVHLAQAGVDLALAKGAYTHGGTALALGAACAIESVLVAAVTLGAGRLVRVALLGDALFGMVGLGAMSLATSATPGRAGSLNWMLPYTVATAAGLGLVAMGDLVAGPGGQPGWLHGAWAGAVAAGLAGAYVVSMSFPHRLPDERTAQIWGNAANYPLFFAAATLAVVIVRRRLAVIALQNADVTRAAASLAHEAQWRAVAIDVFGPVIELLDRVADLGDGEVPKRVRDDADRLILMIEAVRPLASCPVSSVAYFDGPP